MKLIPNGCKSNDVVMTPDYLAEKIVEHFNPSGKILEPCCGNGVFLKYLPTAEWCEITKGKDFFDYNNKVDWIITNPPWSKMRKFIQHSMEVSDNIVFLTTINHLWLKARLRDIKQANFGVREIVLVETPKEFPQSGFQLGVFHLQRNYNGNIIFCLPYI